MGPWWALLLGGCSAVLGLDGLSFDRTDESGGAGGIGAAAGSGGEAGGGALGGGGSAPGGGGAAQGGGGAAPGGGGQGGTGTGGSGTGGTGGTGTGTGGEVFIPLVTEGSIGANAVSTVVDPRFRVGFTEGGNWQLETWFDLGSDPFHDLGPDSALPPGTEVLFNPVYFDVASNWYDLEGANIVDAALYEKAEPRTVVHATLAMPAFPALHIETTYSVYATGRIGTQLLIENTGPTPFVFDDVEHGYTTANASDAWTITPIGVNAALTFQRTDAPSGTPTLVVINHDGVGAVGSDATDSRYFGDGQVTIPAQGTLERDVELQVWPSGTPADLLARIDDARNPELVNVTGGFDAGYRFWDAAYYVRATSNLVTFAPSSTRPRYHPAFFIADWSSNVWSVRLGGELLCSSADRVGPRAAAVAYNGYALIIVFHDVIPTTATLAERTFTVRDTL